MTTVWSGGITMNLMIESILAPQLLPVFRPTFLYNVICSFNITTKTAKRAQPPQPCGTYKPTLCPSRERKRTKSHNDVE